MRMYDIIMKKRDGGVLSDEEIGFFVDGVVDGSIPDYQSSALLMAIYFRGLNAHETAVLTDRMAHSVIWWTCPPSMGSKRISTPPAGSATRLR